MIAEQADALAYGLLRLPGTFAAVYESFVQIKERLPALQVKSLLDLGSGLGSVLYAAEAQFEMLEQATLLERSKEMQNTGEALADALSSIARSWQEVDITTSELQPHDMVTASYVFAELAPEQTAVLLEKMWQVTKKVLCIVEPGTPGGYARIEQMKKHLAAWGGNMIAPCATMKPCPLEADFCHFTARTARTRMLQEIKQGQQSYEDEAFLFLAVAKDALAEREEKRIIRRPEKGKGHIKLTLCSKEGIQKETITKKQAAYKKIRKAKWGERIPLQ